MNPEQSAALRKPFPPESIGKLPKAGITLDYIGHATTTDRLLSVDPEWSWEPLAYADDGGPLIRQAGKELTLWIRLTVCGVTRIGVGSVAPNAFDAEKQLVGDALRNAAMRFGVALDLWSKAELESEHVTKNTVTCPRCSFAAERPAVRSHLIDSHGYVPGLGGRVLPPPTTSDASSTGSPAPQPAAPDNEGPDPSAGVGSSPPMTDGQRRKLQALCGERGLAERQARVDWGADTIGRHLTSFSELTKVEAGTLIEAAEALPVAPTLEGVSP